jgi:hypothetical protein
MADLEITKLDAARRQLRTALHLWFGDGDPVSIHTLLAAAHEIIHRLYRNKGLVNLVFDTDLIKDEYRGEFAKKIKEAPNFFKHANHDTDKSILFNPEANDYMAMFLLQALADMGEEFGLEERAYIWWLLIRGPHVFQSKGKFLPAEIVQNLKGINKKQFLQACELLHGQGQLRNFLGPRPPELKGR